MKAYCLHTVHYVKEGEKNKQTVAKAGSIADGMPEDTFDELKELSAVREATPVDEAKAAEASAGPTRRVPRAKADKSAKGGDKTGDDLV